MTRYDPVTNEPYEPGALELAEDDLACALSLRQHADTPPKREVAARIVARCRLALAEARSEDSDTGPGAAVTASPVEPRTPATVPGARGASTLPTESEAA